MESIYWVFTHRCNQYCGHCYNHSRPGGPTVTMSEADAVIEHLPDTNRLILSGGEPLTEPALLLYILRRANEKYGTGTHLSLQTNGDLLDADTLDSLLGAGVQHISIASQDPYHARRKGLRQRLRELLLSRGLLGTEVGDPLTTRPGQPTFSFWGATPDLWLGGLWARGRALRNGIWEDAPDHNVCALWSGALGFLDDGSNQQEIAIQLTSVYPCCPGTVEALGDVAREPLLDILDCHRGDPMWEALNRGEPEAMGTHVGVDPEFARRRIRELGNVCLWCDEYLTKYRRQSNGSCNEATQLWAEGERPRVRRGAPLVFTGGLAGDD